MRNTFRSIRQRITSLADACFPWHLLAERKAHLYCVGTAKSGTSSIGTLFEDRLRSRHEPEPEQTTEIILKREEGAVTDRQLRRYLLNRDRRLWLEIDSSQRNFFFLDELVDLFPGARFILTLRDPYSWLDSFLNHQLGRDAPHKWPLLRDLRFQQDQSVHPPEESALSKRGLYTLDEYLSYWTRHNETVLDTVPEDRLLVVRTHEITERAPDIAAFAGLSTEAVNRQRFHANKAQHRFQLLKEIEVAHLFRKVQTHCASLLKDYFPDLHEPNDALPYLPPLPANTHS